MKLLALSVILALAAAGCVTPPADELEAAAADLEAASVAPVVTEVAHDGQIGPVVCVNVCALSALGQSRIFETAAEGVVDVALAFEWDAASPRTSTLYGGIFTCDPEACFSDSDLSHIEWVEGESPLTIDLKDFEVPEGETLFIFANAPALVGGPVYVQVSTPQPFTVTGTLSAYP